MNACFINFDSYNLVSTLLLSLIIQIVFFVFAAIFKTDKVTDLSYGLTFILLAFFSFLKSKVFSFYQIIITALILLWGIRLASYLFIRILKIKKDKRFDGIRENFLKFAMFWFFQAISVWIIILPATIVLNSNILKPFNIFGSLGVLVWFLGISIETVADMQKFSFKNVPKNKGKWVNTGLWKYSRHPNYFGEMLCWWGIFILSLPFLKGLLLLSALGPLYITFILLFVSGVPTLEKKYDQRFKDNKEYWEYKRKTSLLIPLPNKK